MTKGFALLVGTAAMLLGLDACGQQSNQTAETNGAADNAAAMNEPITSDSGAETAAGATADAGSVTAGGSSAASGSSAAQVTVVAPPLPPPGVPVAAAAPLTEAATITQSIDEGAEIERVPYQGGWAWRRNGRIVRTASGDGRRVSYFRPDEQTPFLVQQDRQAVALSHGSVQRAYTPQGRPEAPDSSTRRSGEQLARQAVQDRKRAIVIATTQPSHVQKERPSAGGTQTHSPSATSSRPDGSSADRTSSENRHGTDSRSRDDKTDSHKKSAPANDVDANQAATFPPRA